MNKLISFFYNNRILFFSLYCVLIYDTIARIFFHQFSYLIYEVYCYYFVIAFIVFAIFYSFYQSIKNRNSNKVYAFVLLIFYLVAWGFFTYDFFDYGVNEISVTKFSVFILINSCFFLYSLFKKKDIYLIIYLMFYGSNSVLIYFLMTI